MTNMANPNVLLLRRLLETRGGRPILSAADCEWLALDMRTKLKDGPSVNTIKRLLGFLPYNKQHRDSTFSFVARYLGYDNVHALQQALNQESSDFGSCDGMLEIAQLKMNDQVEVSYPPNRLLTFVYKGDGKSMVKQSVNSKLKQGDEVKILQFALRFPLLIENVVRNGKSLGQYTAGRIGGLTSVKW